MSFEFVVVSGAVLLLLAGLWFFGDDDLRRRVRVLAVATLAVITISVAVAQRPDDQSAGTPTAPTAVPSAAPAASPTAESVGSGASAEPSESPRVIRLEVAVAAGRYRIFLVDGKGVVTDARAARFDHSSMAPVERVQASNGVIHWRITSGGYDGWSFIPGRSGSFVLRETIRLANGGTLEREIDPAS